MIFGGRTPFSGRVDGWFADAVAGDEDDACAGRRLNVLWENVMKKALVILPLLVVATGCVPSESREGANWSHGELIEYLHGQGLDFNAEETDLGTFFGPAMDFTFVDHQVYVQVRKTPQEAKDLASTKNGKAFAWGRFFFRGDPEHLKEIRSVLP